MPIKDSRHLTAGVVSSLLVVAGRAVGKGVGGHLAAHAVVLVGGSVGRVAWLCVTMCYYRATMCYYVLTRVTTCYYVLLRVTMCLGFRV